MAHERAAAADPWKQLDEARRRYDAALRARNASAPGSPGYREAVADVGRSWNVLRYWQRRVDLASRVPITRQTDPP